MKTICAFANDLDNWGGGYIVLGVEDDNGRPKFPVKGLNINKVDDIMQDLLNKCKQIKPSETELTELFTLANHVPFDDRICHQAELTDLKQMRTGVISLPDCLYGKDLMKIQLQSQISIKLMSEV